MMKIVIITLLCLHLASSAKLDCVCGKEGPGSGQTRIVNGVPVGEGKFPWMIALLAPRSQGGYYQFCGASIINDQWLLTAAHCVPDKQPQDIYAVRNEINMQQIDQENVMRVDRIWTHPQYIGESNGYHNDIALLHLARSIKFNQKVSPVCLPTGDMVNFDNLFNIGWGKTSVSGPGSMDLLYIETHQSDVCTKAYANLQFWEKQICTYAVGNGICQGDSGGPLSTRKNGHVAQVGINSWVISGTCGQYPDVTTRVTSYLNEIRQVTSGSGWCYNPLTGTY